MKSARILLTLGLLALLLGSGGCSATDATQIVLVVDTDLSVPEEVETVQLEITGPGGMSETERVDLSAGAPRPVTLGLRPAADVLGPIRIVASARKGGAAIIVRTITTSFIQDRSLLLQILLTGDCQGVSCAAEQSCAAGTCVPIALAPESLPSFTGTIPGWRPGADAGPDGCSGGAEVCNGRDDDCDGVIDNGIDLTSSAADCGSCGHACGALAGVATGACNGGHCAVSCRSGFADCNGDPDDGCEAELSADPDHCSSCDLACDFSHATGTCASATCSVSTCESGFGDCDGDGANGCEVDLTTPANCGRCGHDCGVTACQGAGFCAGEEIIGLGAGSLHTCALRQNGQVACWGLGANGQLGTGATSSSRVPTAVLSVPPGVTSVAAGGRQSCLVAGDRAYCWGYNMAGQLGDGTTFQRNSPTPVSGSRTVLDHQLVQGSGHGCAVMALMIAGGGAGAFCWGTNRNGQLGDGSVMDRPQPGAVDTASFGGAEPVRVTAGQSHSCAVLSDGRVFCWGQLDASALSHVLSPLLIEVASGSDLNLSAGAGPVTSADVALVAGAGFTCAKAASGQVLCWGDNSFGQLGDGSILGSSIRAVQVMGLNDAVSVSAGDNHACALRTDGRVSCWGANGSGQLGVNDSAVSEAHRPMDVVDQPADVAEIACGGSHTCLRTSGGAVYCVGSNSVGQLGDGTLTARMSPTPVSALP